MPKRILAFHRKRGTACVSSFQIELEVGVRLVHRLAPARGASRTSRDACPVRCWPVRSSVMAVCTSSGVQRIHSRAPIDVLEALVAQARAHLVVGEERSVLALGELVDVDRVVLLHLRGLELLLDSRLHVLRGLPDLEQPVVRAVVDRSPGVDAQPGLRLLGQELLDRPTHRSRRPSDSIGRIIDLDEARLSSAVRPYFA